MKQIKSCRIFCLFVFIIWSVDIYCQDNNNIRIDDVLPVPIDTSLYETEILRLKSGLAGVNLTPYQPGGWDNKIVLSTVTGTNTSAPMIFEVDNIYLDWAALNNGTDDISATFYIRLYVDGVSKAAWTKPGLIHNTYTWAVDYNLGKLSAGTHTAKIVVDSDGHVAETNETDNEYTRTFTVLPNINLTPYQPSGWDNKVVLSTVTGTHTSASAIYNNQDIYIDWAVTNNGTAAAVQTFHTKLYVDGVLKNSWTTPGLSAGGWAYIGDYNIGKLAIGSHTIQIVVDADGEVTETMEGDNTYIRTFSVGPSYNLTPYQPGGWDDKLILSTVTGTNTSASVIFDNQDIYVDWAAINNAFNDITGTFSIRLFIDGVSRKAWTKTGLVHNTYTWYVDDNLGKLPAGTHTARLVVDADGQIAESDETDNEYIRTFTVFNKNLLPNQPSGWDNKIVLSTVTGTNTTAATICENQPVYLDWSVMNNGNYAVTETFYVRLFIDGVAKATWTRAGLAANTYFFYQDYSLGTFAAGTHTARIVADVLDNVNETSEADNEYTLTFTVSTCKNLIPYQLAAWDNKIVLSTVPGTTTSSATFYDNQTIYLDWAVLNMGLVDLTETFTTKLYIDGVFKTSWSKAGLGSGAYLYYSDFNIGLLPQGNHTFKLVVDADNSVAETNETDNEYSRTISVLKYVLPAPVATAATGITQNGFSANWNAVAGASGYYLDVSISNSFGSLVPGYNNKDVGNNLTSAVTNLAPGITYYYRLRAYDATTTSSSSNTITTVTIPPAPVANSATGITQTGFNANWNASTGATGYYLDVSTSNAFSGFVTGYNNRNIGNVTTAFVTGLAAGTTYFYRLRAYNDSGTGGNSNTINLSTVVGAPAAPVATTATGTSQNGFSANWNVSTGATGYYLDVSTSSLFSGFIAGYNNKDVGNITTWPVTGLSASTTYYYRLRAYNAGGTSGNSNIISITTGVNAPAAPVAITATGITQTGFNANWNISAGATGYYLDVSTSSTFSGFVTGYNNKNVGNVLTSPVTELSPGTAYFYRIRAYNAGGASGYSNTISVTTGINAPSAPLASAATAITQTSFIANWNFSAEATGYYLDVSSSDTFSDFISGYNNKNLGNTTFIPVTELTPGITYYYRLKAYNTGGVSGNSNTIAVITLPVIPAAPMAGAATSVTRSGFAANWNAAANATGYYLDVSTTSSFVDYVTGYFNKDVGSVTTIPVTGLVAGTTYYYRLRAYNSGGTSVNSNTISAVFVDNPPVVLNKINDQQVNAARTLTIPVSPVLGQIFDDPDQGEILTISAYKENSIGLPSFMIYTNNNLVASPLLTDTGCYNIVVKAQDLSNAFITDTFKICVKGYYTEIREANSSPDFRLFPNPSSGKVTILTDNRTSVLKITVTNILGSEIFCKAFDSGESVTFDLSDCTPGTYLVRLTYGEEEIIKKIILMTH